MEQNTVTELRSIFSGRCYSICYLQIVQLNPITFYLKQDWDVNLYIHNRGEEYWISFGDFHTEKTFLHLDTFNQEGVSAIGKTKYVQLNVSKQNLSNLLLTSGAFHTIIILTKDCIFWSMLFKEWEPPYGFILKQRHRQRQRQRHRQRQRQRQRQRHRQRQRLRDRGREIE